MITPELLSLLCCPLCKSSEFQISDEKRDQGRAMDAGSLQCSRCRLEFPVSKGIPDFIPYQALTTERWEVWKGHLRGFEARRQRRAEHPSPQQAERWKKTNAAFFQFADIPAGRLLDVGCGPGGMRFSLLDRKDVQYIGLDPLPALRDGYPFPFVRAIAEYLPFPDASFSSMLVNSALDHFCDTEAFFLEAARVLRPDGKMFIQQSVHQVRNPVSLAKALAHELRDTIDGVRSRSHEQAAVPKHISEFSQSSLLETVTRHFRVQSLAEFSPTWYSPTRSFLAVEPLRQPVETR